MNDSTTQAIVITAPGKAEVREFPSRTLQPREVRVANIFTAVSVGTEYLVVSGQLHGCAFPCLLGYQGVGRIVEVGVEVRDYRVGERVCSGISNFQPPGYGQGAGNAQQSHPIVSDTGDWAQTELIRIPDGVSDEEAAYAWLVSVSQQGVEMARVQAGDVVAVVGLGMVGQFAAQLTHARGAKVYACDLAADRVALAQQHSADVAMAGDTTALDKRVRADHPQGATVVIECTGNTKVLDAALDMTATQGRFVMQGHYPGMVSFRFLASHAKRLTMLCPCAWGDLRPVLRAMAEGQVKVSPWIGTIATPDQVPPLYQRIHQRDPALMAALIRWSGVS